ncbi:MAG: hypothetical protein OXC08_06600 [Thiotrichales bacterium]|nr:hypothetical protein [Thiotrichales bacterium]
MSEGHEKVQRLAECIAEAIRESGCDMGEATAAVGLAFVAAHGDAMNAEMTREILAESGVRDGLPTLQ